MKVGDRVKVIGVPFIIRKCLGEVFEIQALENVEGLTYPLIKLDVRHVLGKQSWEDTIWIGPEFVELAD